MAQPIAQTATLDLMETPLVGHCRQLIALDVYPEDTHRPGSVAHLDRIAPLAKCHPVATAPGVSA